MLGAAIGASALIYHAVYPLLIGFNAVPKVAVVPILVIWFGIGTIPAIITAFLLSFFPIVVNVATGIATVEPELRDVLRALGASPLDIIRQDRPAARHAVFLRQPKDRHHGRLRRLDPGGDRRPPTAASAI